MLIEFSVENFLSIKDKVTLSMVASKDNSLKDNLILNNGKIGNLFKTSVIYGPNGSGKSNILRALNFLSFFISNSHEMQQNKKIPVEPFKLEKKYLNKPSSFEIVFIAEETKYTYGFSASEENVTEEYLYYYPNGRQSIIFERKDINKYKFTNDVEIQNQIKDKFHSDNKLFLSTLSTWDYKKAQKPFEWLNNNLKTLNYNKSLESFTIKLMRENQSIHRKVISLLNSICNDIEDITFDEIKMDLQENPILKILSDEAKESFFNKSDNIMVNVNTIHKMNDSNELVKFDLSDESDGIQKLFAILGYWLKILDDGSTLIVDELDIGFHTRLTSFLVSLFNNKEINKKGAQLIFTTHDTNLLNNNLFRRDQIWFTEKKNDNSSNLYSLYSLKLRKDLALEKGYLEGKYGALPNFDHIKF